MTTGDADRRVAAILEADVADYSLLMKADTYGTITALDAHITELFEPSVASYRGSITNRAGDAVVAEFPSAEDALRCAMDIQCAMPARDKRIPKKQRIEFRIGIDVGDVHGEGDIRAVAVNLAARLEALAGPGGTSVSAAVRHAVHGRLNVDFEDMGEQTVKKDVIRAYRVLLPGQLSRRISLGMR